ncbi:MAG: hypothetical protein NC937_03490 [Candidatus Omnitrophica bacterium]|nr:hypothetical protein [Candidatus Omnitrophota bacterium]MCM8825201.1 hypothetical protein [Candidatus Omnitrophota bacterium]
MVFSKDTLERIKKIHNLSLRVNTNNHRKKLLGLAQKHIKEINQLYSEKNPHADIETGDLAVLCFELILESGKNPDEVLEKCFERYEKKLNELLKQDSL